MKHALRKTLGAIVLGCAAQASHAADVTLRFHQFLPPQATIPALAIKPWAEKIEKESGGRIKVQRFDSMQLGGKPPELFDQAKDGVADIVWTVLGYTPGRFPKTEAFELPFTTGLAEPGSRAFQEFVEKNAMDEGDKRGLGVSKKAGNNIITLSPEETARWRRVANGTRAIWYKEVASKGLDGQKLAAEADALVAKYAKK